MSRTALAGVVLCACLGGCSDGPGTGPHSSPSLVRACMRATACGYQPYPRLPDCLSNYAGRIAAAGLQAVATELYACVDLATSCAEVATCFGARGDCDRGFQASCEGGDAVYCDLLDKRVYTHGCTAAGMACHLDPAFQWSGTCTGRGTTAKSLQTGCDEGFCAATGESCGSLSPSDRCAGDQLESCFAGEWLRLDCSALSLGSCRVEGTGPSTTWARCGAPG